MVFADRQVWTDKEVAKLLAVINSELRFGEEVLENLPAGLLVVAPDLSLLAANRPLRRLLLLAERPLSELRFQDLFPEEEIRRAVLETFESAGKQASLQTRQRHLLRVTARSYGSWPEDRKAVVLVQETAPLPAPESDPQPLPSRAAPPSPKTAGGGLPGAIRAGIILAFVVTGVVRRLLFGAPSQGLVVARSRSKIVPFPQPAGRVPAPDRPQRTATG